MGASSRFFSTYRTTPICMLFPSRDTPNVVFQGETATMRAQVWHSDASLPPCWRDSAPKVTCTSYHDFLDSAQLPCILLRHLLEGFFFSVRGPFRGCHFISESACVFFPVTSFQRKEGSFIILRVQSVSLQHFTCSKYSLAGDASATGPVILPAFLSQPPLETFLLLICQRQQ